MAYFCYFYFNIIVRSHVEKSCITLILFPSACLVCVQYSLWQALQSWCLPQPAGKELPFLVGVLLPALLTPLSDILLQRVGGSLVFSLQHLEYITSFLF